MKVNNSRIRNFFLKLCKPLIDRFIGPRIQKNEKKYKDKTIIEILDEWHKSHEAEYKKFYSKTQKDNGYFKLLNSFLVCYPGIEPYIDSMLNDDTANLNQLMRDSAKTGLTGMPKDLATSLLFDLGSDRNSFLYWALRGHAPEDLAFILLTRPIRNVQSQRLAKTNFISIVQNTINCQIRTEDDWRKFVRDLPSCSIMPKELLYKLIPNAPKTAQDKTEPQSEQLDKIEPQSDKLGGKNLNPQISNTADNEFEAVIISNGEGIPRIVECMKQFISVCGSGKMLACLYVFLKVHSYMNSDCSVREFHRLVRKIGYKHKTARSITGYTGKVDFHIFNTVSSFISDNSDVFIRIDDVFTKSLKNFRPNKRYRDIYVPSK